eukprot:1672793-Pyramimonas_sp.AAC.1
MEASEAVTAVLERLREERDSEKTVSQRQQAQFAKLNKAQKQLEAQTRYVQEQMQALQDLE